MSKQRTFDRDDDTGVFHRQIDEARNISRITNMLARATIKRGGSKRILLAMRDYERAEGLRELLKAEGVTDPISIATSAVSACESINATPPLLVVAETELFDICEQLGCRVVELNGDDTKTAREVKDLT